MRRRRQWGRRKTCEQSELGCPARPASQITHRESLGVLITSSQVGHWSDDLVRGSTTRNARVGRSSLPKSLPAISRRSGATSRVVKEGAREWGLGSSSAGL